MNETNVMAPLQAFHGLKPPAPIWFENAIAEEPERTFVTVEGARVETLAWGKRGNPGLVFLHGGAAHADWWSFVAPFFARERRVVAPTFTGMGRSDWRQVYSFDQFVREAREAGRAAGAYEAGPPTVVGHSFGGRVAMGLAGDFGEELQGAVMVDPPFFAKENLRPRSPPRPTKERRIQHSLAAVVARFRLAPPQVCENLFILDFIARRSAAEIVDAEGKRGWALMLRSAFLGEVHPHRPDRAHHRRPLAAGAHPWREVAALPPRGRRLPLEPHPSRLALCRDPRGRASRDDRPADRLRGGAARAACGVAAKALLRGAR